MTVPMNQSSGGFSTQGDDQPQKIQNQSVSGTSLKEQEAKPLTDKEDKIVAEIKTRAEALDSEAIESVRTSIQEARLATPEPKVPPELADTGIKTPQEEANKVVAEGSTIELPLTEQEYKTGLHQKVKAAVVDKVVIGASSLFALAAWVGRIIKIAHKHTMKVIFRREEKEDAN